MSTADELKALGNKAIAAKNFDEAIEKFTEAIALDPSNHILFSNRSAAYASKKDWVHALADAEQTTTLKPDWAKGWSRKGSALFGQRQLLAAYEAYETGLKIDPANAGMKNDIAAVERAMDVELQTGPGAAAGGSRSTAAGGDGTAFEDPTRQLTKLFADPNLLAKLAANPRTSAFLADPTFVQNLQRIQSDPQAAQSLFFSDQRMIQVMGVLMGIDMDLAPEAPGAASTAAAAEHEEDVPMGGVPKAAAATPAAAAAAAEPAPAPEPEAEEEDEEAQAQKAAKAAADAEKALGTASYKKRDFPAAIAHYQKAWELFKDITYLNNLGAAYFEQGDFQACVDACTKAVEEGRAVFADFKTMAKAYARIGTAEERLGHLDAAVEHYNKSLREQRTADVVAKLRAVERRRIDEARAAYVDPAKAEEARETGNRQFKASDWPGAVAAYTEMIKRAPDDPRGYSNRAAAFIKLLEFPSALDDCEAAIAKDPTFVRAYIRKAQAYLGMRKYSDCIDVCATADQIDRQHHHGANAREIEQQQQKALTAMYSTRENETEEETRARIMQDPEIMATMQDPVMQAILQQAQSDPAALNEHMKNPSVRAKIQKLVAAGVIRVGR